MLRKTKITTHHIIFNDIFRGILVDSSTELRILSLKSFRDVHDVTRFVIIIIVDDKDCQQEREVVKMEYVEVDS